MDFTVIISILIIGMSIYVGRLIIQLDSKDK